MAENVQQKNQSLPLTLQKSTYKIIIPTKVESIIRLLCSEVKQVEWSGALFYTYTGSFETNDLVITCQDICVMDIGNGGYTEFVESPIIINYQMEKDLLDCKIGLIHSHNVMPTFFSGTDTSTLRSEGSAMNNFVSLIVNNAGNYSAAITRLVHAIRDVRSSKTYRFFGEGEVDMGSSQYYEDSYEVEYFNLEIEKHVSDSNDILSRLEEIRKTKSAFTSTLPMPKKGSDYDIDAKSFKAQLQSLQKDKANTTKSNVQPTLFDDPEDLNYFDIPLTKSIVDTATLQIITGSILVTPNTKINVKDWIKKMETLYTNRFPNFADFEYWIDNHIDSVLTTTNLDELDDLDGDCATAVLAYQVSLNLEEHKEGNEFIATICNALDKYII